MLSAVATEDLSRARELAVLPLEEGEDLTQALSVTLPKARITLLPVAATRRRAQGAIAAFLAGYLAFATCRFATRACFLYRVATGSHP